MSDIQRMCGTFSLPDSDGETATISGTAPVSTMYDYSKEVVRYTHGRGRLVCSLKGYEPCHNADEVIAEFGYDCDADADNPCDSVFCSHGAGYIVKWDEVKSHMHLPSVLSERRVYSESEAARSRLSSCKDSADFFALDKELMQIFEQTYGPVKRRTNDSESRRITFTKSSEEKSYKKPRQQKYEDEYLLVDGYNVIFSWDKLKKIGEESIEDARDALVNILCNYQGYKKCEVILVFDAYKVKGGSREVEKFNNINIVYTKEAETADMYIEKTTHKLARNNKVMVVTSDALEQIIIFGNGALRISSKEFFYEVQQMEEEIRRIISEGV